MHFKLLCATGLVAIFSSTISKSPVLPLFASYLGLSPAMIGVVAGVSSFTGIVCSIPAGVLSDRFGRKRMLLVSTVVFATAPLLYLLARDVISLSAIRFYHGVATAIFVPVAMAMVADIFSTERGLKMGWFSTSTLAGRFLAPMVGGAVLGLLASSALLSFQAVYIICAVAGISAFVLSTRLPDDNLSTSNKTLADALRGLKSILSNRLILVTCIVEASILFAYGAFETFMPLYSKSVGITSYEIGICLSTQIITLAVTKPSMGKLSDKFGRAPQIIIGAFLGAISIAILPYCAVFVLLVLNSILFGLSLSVVTSATSAYIADLADKSTQGSAMGLLGSIMDIGHTTGPIVTGVIVGVTGYDIAFLTAGLLLIIVAGCFWVVKKFTLRTGYAV